MQISLKVLNGLLTEAYDDGYLRGCAEASDKNAAAAAIQYQAGNQTGIAGKANDSGFDQNVAGPGYADMAREREARNALQSQMMQKIQHGSEMGSLGYVKGVIAGKVQESGFQINVDGSEHAR